MNAFGEPPAISELFLLTPIAEIEELAVYRVDDSVPPAIRARAAAVAYAATQDMPSFKVAYDGSSTPERLRMYVVLSSALAVAMLTVATTKRC